MHIMRNFVEIRRKIKDRMPTKDIFEEIESRLYKAIEYSELDFIGLKLVIINFFNFKKFLKLVNCK